MREKPRDNERLIHILEAIDNILEFKEGKSFADFENDKLLKFAIIKNLEIIGEAVYMLSKPFKKIYHFTPWDDISKMRHILVHDYYQIKLGIIWATISSDISVLKTQVINIQESLKTD